MNILSGESNPNLWSMSIRRPISCILYAYDYKVILVLMILERTVSLSLNYLQGTFFQAVISYGSWSIWITVLIVSILYKLLLDGVKEVTGVDYIKGELIFLPEVERDKEKAISLSDYEDTRSSSQRNNGFKKPKIYNLNIIKQKDVKQYDLKTLPEIIKTTLGSDLLNSYGGYGVFIFLVIILYSALAYNLFVLGPKGVLLYNVFGIYHSILFVYGLAFIIYFLMLGMNFFTIIRNYYYFLYLLSKKIPQDRKIKLENDENDEFLLQDHFNLIRFRINCFPLIEVVRKPLIYIIIPFILLCLSTTSVIFLNTVNLTATEKIYIAALLIALYIFLVFVIILAYVVPQLLIAGMVKELKEQELNKVDTILWNKEQLLMQYIHEYDYSSTTLTNSDNSNKLMKDIESLQLIKAHIRSEDTSPTSMVQNMRLVFGLLIAGVTSLGPTLLRILGL